jgi:CheY-like chemotaxis protein
MTDACTLLLVDDDAITRDVLSILLENAGWTVTTAVDGTAALDSLATETPSVILCDLHMPGLCGTALAVSLRQQAATPVLLAMTATPLPATPEGYDALLIKPFRPEAVRKLFDTLWQKTLPQALVAENTYGSGVLDPIVLEHLGNSMPPDRLWALIAFVADDADSRIARMHTAALEGDATRFRAEAHALKGSCGMVGALDLKQLAAHAEDEELLDEPLMKWKSYVQFVDAVEAIRLMLKTLQTGTE